MIWIVRLMLTALVAGTIALVGYQLMFKEGADRWRLDGRSVYFVLPSIMLWLALAFVLHRQSYLTAIGWGLLSPFIGSLCVAWLAGPFLVLTAWHITLPIGIITGLLVRLCVSVGSGSGIQSDGSSRVGNLEDYLEEKP